MIAAFSWTAFSESWLLKLCQRNRTEDLPGLADHLNAVVREADRREGSRPDQVVTAVRMLPRRAIIGAVMAADIGSDDLVVFDKVKEVAGDG